MDLELPSGFTDLLQEFTIQVLQDKPDDIVEFAANYFMKLKLKEKRSKEGTKKKSKGVSFQSGEVNGDENSDDDEDEEMGMKMYSWHKFLQQLRLCSLHTSMRSGYRYSGRSSRTSRLSFSLAFRNFTLLDSQNSSA